MLTSEESFGRSARIVTSDPATMSERVAWKELPRQDSWFDVEAGGKSQISKNKSCCTFKRTGIGVCFILLVILCTVYYSIDYEDKLAKREFVSAMNKSFGTATSVAGVEVGILAARTEISKVRVANPPGYASDFLDLGNGVFDATLWSLLSDGVLIEELSLDQLDVSLAQKDTLAPNFVTILQTAMKASKESSVQSVQSLRRADERKYTVNRVEMSNLNLHMDMEATVGGMFLKTPPAVYRVERVQINGIGKGQGGVTLEELMLIVATSLVSAAVQAAPSNIGAAMTGALCAGIDGFDALQHLDYEGLNYDVGEGWSQLSKLVDRMGNSTADLVSPEFASAAINSAVTTASDVGDVMAGALVDTSTVWNHAMAEDSNEQAFVTAMNGTADVLTDAWATLQERTKEDGNVGNTVAQAMNSTKAMSTVLKDADAIAEDRTKQALITSINGTAAVLRDVDSSVSHALNATETMSTLLNDAVAKDGNKEALVAAMNSTAGVLSDVGNTVSQAMRTKESAMSATLRPRAAEVLVPTKGKFDAAV